jgi:hypothetical protein
MNLKSIIPALMYKFYKTGRSAKKFSESQIRKFAKLNNLFDLRAFRKRDTSRIFAICGPNLFCDLRTSNFRKSTNAYPFSLQI